MRNYFTHVSQFVLIVSKYVGCFLLVIALALSAMYLVFVGPILVTIELSPEPSGWSILASYIACWLVYAAIAGTVDYFLPSIKETLKRLN